MNQLNPDIWMMVIEQLHSCSDICKFCQLNNISYSVCRARLPFIIRQLIKHNYCLLYDAAIDNYLPIVKLFVENNADKSAINTAFKWGSIYDNSVRYYLLSIVQNNSLTKTREFEGAMRLKDLSKLESMMNNRVNDLEDEINLDILLEAMKTKTTFKTILEFNFDLNAIHDRGTLLNKLLSNQDTYFKEIDLIKQYGAKTLGELNITPEMLEVNF